MIIVGGDSFIYGSELSDCDGVVSQSTFPALLSKGQEYNCVAWPGFGNDSIARTVIAECERCRDMNRAVLVSWTFPGRYEFRFNYLTRQRTLHWYTINSWDIEDGETIKKYFQTWNQSVFDSQMRHINTAKETGIHDFAKTFYHHVGSSEYWETYSVLKEIVYLQNYLKANRIPYVFMSADVSVFKNSTVNSNDPTISSLYGQIDFDRYFFFPSRDDDPKGFYQWALENKYAIGTTHPLEQAHVDAANLMRSKFDELVKEYLEQDHVRDPLSQETQRTA